MKARKPGLGRQWLTPSRHALDGGAVNLAFSGTCRKCGRDYISVLHPFSRRYVCPECRPEELTAWLATGPRCTRGHLLTALTLRYNAEGKKGCRLCEVERSREARAARKAAAS